jgi:beta-galactosidase/beta-glucuronidase
LKEFYYGGVDMKNLSKIITQVLSITSFLIFSFWIFSEHVSANSLTEVDLSSNSAWTLSIDGSSTWRSVIVPGGGFNSDQQSPRIDQTTISDHVEYKRSITIPNIASTQVTKLSFGAVNHGAEIYINSTLVGSHVGPMMPFEVDISSYVTPGSTYTLSVKAYDKNHYKNTSNQYTVPVGFYYPYNGNYSANFGLGITKYVKIVAYPQVSIKDVFVRPSVTNQNLFYDVWVDNHSSSAKTVTLQGNLTSWNGDNWTYPSISDTTVNVPGNSVTKVTIGPVSWTLGSTSYWWPNIPFNETYSAKLHNLNLTLKEGTTTWDSKVQRFGFSQYTEGSNYYMINGVRVNHISDGTPESGYSSYDAFSTSAAFLPPTGANTGAPETFKRFMRLGVNTNRIHQSTPTEYMMNAADEVGFMMIPETAMRGYENEVYDAVYSDQAVKDLAQAARNHPSVVRYSLSNEVPVWSQLIDAIQTVDNTRPYVYETSQSNNSPQIIYGTVGHAYTMNHYVGYPTPATIISGIGEFAWDNNHNSYDLNTVADQGKDMRKNDIAYFAPWDWINMWPNLLEGMNHNNHAWKNDNHADRVDGVDGWNSNIVNYVQKSFQPYLIMDNGIEASNSYSVNWPSNVPTYSQNGSITET